MRVTNPFGQWNRGDVVELPDLMCQRYRAAGFLEPIPEDQPALLKAPQYRMNGKRGRRDRR